MYKILEGCPRCRTYPVRASHLRGPIEWLRSRIFYMRPYRCIACGWRGWANESFDRRKRTDPKRAIQGRRAGDRKMTPPTLA
jgi:hypothetical protein